MRSAPEYAALAALALLAACPNDQADTHAPADTSETSASATRETSAGATTEPTTEAAPATTTGELDCTPLTRCGTQCVDPSSDVNNCGDCGIACRIDHATAACIDHTCTFSACEPGHADCDDQLLNGCEHLLGPGESCPLTCAPELPELCNLFDDDCDTTCDETVDGCRQPVHRARSDTLGRLYTLDPREAASGDYTVEFLNYFHLYTQPQPGLVPFYRCRLPDDQHYYTTSATCDDIATPESSLGHLAPTPLCGAVPLYRLSNGVHTNYFYTHDPAERDDALANQGYLYEAIAGHVWPTP